MFINVRNHTTDRLRIKLSRADGCFDVIHPATGDGWHGLQFYMRCGETEHRPKVFTEAKTGQGKSRWQIEVAPKVQVHFDASPSPTGAGIWLKPTLVNRSNQAYVFTGYGLATAHTGSGPRLGHRGLTVFAHAENLRYENLPISQPSFPFIRPLPTSGRWFGRQGQGPIPALVLGKDSQDRWLVEGGASQMRAVMSWYLGLPTRPGRMLDYGCEFFWNGGTQDCVAPGESIALESWVYLIVNAKPDQIYLAYMEELARLYGDRFAGTTSRLATEAVYTTCNYGIYTKITEADCVKRIKQLGKLQGGIFQIDHGFQPPHQEQLSRGYLDAFYPNPGESWDPRRFAGGPKRIVEVSRQHGLTPAIWWTPRMEVDGPIARAHPDWIAVNRQGNPIEHVGDLHPDYSVAAVREFIEKNIRTIVHDWGFEGIKLDFFSWAFDASDLAYRHGGTSVQWRRWLLEMIRRELGPRGYFLYCISCPLGNPFLALDACDSFRTGMDIDRGEWSHHVAGCSWLLASFPACGRSSWFVDIDSFMGSAGCPVHERRFRCAVGYLTSGMLDFSGPIETLDKLALSDYRRLCQRCDQGGTVRVPDREAFFGVPLPKILVRLHSADSVTRRKHGVQATVGLFNWQEAACISGVNLASLGLKTRAAGVRDFWTGRTIRAADGRLNVELPPRHHVMVDVMA